MIRRLPLHITALLLVMAAVSCVAKAAVGPLYDIKTSWGDTKLAPGGKGKFDLWVRNIGDQSSKETLTVKDQLPSGVKVTAIQFFVGSFADDEAGKFCSGVGTEAVKCVFPGPELPTLLEAPGLETDGFLNPLPSGYLSGIEVDVKVGAEPSGENIATVEGGGAPQPAQDVDEIPFGAPPLGFGLVPGSFLADVFTAAYPFGEPDRQAGDHPFEQRFNFDLNLHEYAPTSSSEFHAVHGNEANGLIKTAEVTLPRGVIGNPEATPKCDPVDFAEVGATTNGTACPADTQVGYLNVMSTTPAATRLRNEGLSRVPIYNLKPPQGFPADFAFNAGELVQGHIFFTLDPSHDYAIKSLTPNISSFLGARGAEVTIWGVPGDPAHDKFRFYPEAQPGENELGEEVELASGAPFEGAGIRPLVTTPMDCGEPNGGARISLDSYQEPGAFTEPEEYGQSLDVGGCEDQRFRFEPDITLQPTSRDAGGPTGLSVHLEVPQRNDEAAQASELYAGNGFVKGIGTPPIKEVVVRLPQGMTISPSAAQGLQSCSPAQIGLGSDSPVRCPDASQYGTLTLHTPILPKDAPPVGRIYIAEPYENPFHSFLALYLAIEEPERGILVKVPGKVALDPDTGQITTSFEELPQFPLEDLEMHLKGGLRAGLVNPQTCGKKTIEATFYSWADPNTPHTVKSSYQITQNPDGSPCRNSLSDRPFDPRLSGGTLNPLAGSFSPLELMLTRIDEDQELSRAEGSAPPGLTASLKGITRCPDAAIAAASDPNRTGSQEIANSSCPASSQVGAVDAGAGVGQVLTYVKGKVYLAGPYKGAPLSGVAIVPAVAGPFDLGVVVTRAPAYVNPETAQITLRTDPLPQIFKGVPVRVRDIRVHVDRQGFTLNPTSCEPMSLAGVLFSSEGKSKGAASPFQASDCASLGFKPRISLRLKGGTKRGGHPSLRAVVLPRAGDANIASASVTLPHSAFLDQAHIRTICTRVQFAANACPAGSVYGHAAAYTPLLDEPLEGPVYLRSSSHNLPDLVVALKGPPSLPIEFNLAGRVDSVKGGIRNTFEYAPDAPVSKFVLEMQGAKKGLVINSTDLCAKANKATAKLTGHNGKAYNFKPVVKPDCGKGGKGKHKHRGHSRRG
jgi:hypothetical protein